MEKLDQSIIRNISKYILAFIIAHNSAMLFPSGIQNDTVMIIVKFVIITEFTRSQCIMAVIFLMVELRDFAPTFCHTQKITVRKRLV
jgi:hypothetical protein